MSLDLDFSQVWTQASSFVNSLWPVFVIPIGIILGVAILGLIVHQIKEAISQLG